MGNASDAGLKLAGGVQTPIYRLLPADALAFNLPQDAREGATPGDAGTAGSVVTPTPEVTQPDFKLPATFYDRPQYASSSGKTACKVLTIIGIVAGVGAMAGGIGAYYANNDRNYAFFSGDNKLGLGLLGGGAALVLGSSVGLSFCLK